MLVQCNITGGVAQLTLNRHERRNALCTAMMNELKEHLVHLATDGTVRAIVLSGMGGVFCAGSDLKELAALNISEVAPHEAETATVVRQIMTCPLPVIAAVEGYALGGGCALALACDVVVVTEHARLAMPEVANGWIPPWGLTALRRRCGDVFAQQFLWGAEPYTVSQLAARGLVDHVCAVGEAQACATELANRLSQLPPVAVASTKRFITQALEAETADAICSQLFDENCTTPEARATFEKFTRK